MQLRGHVKKKKKKDLEEAQRRKKRNKRRRKKRKGRHKQESDALSSMGSDGSALESEQQRDSPSQRRMTREAAMEFGSEWSQQSPGNHNGLWE